MRVPVALPSLFVAAAVVLAACSGGASRPADVRTTSLSPAPGSTNVSRRIDVRTAFDADVDPASITPATCRLERADSGGGESTITTYDAPARLLTMTPVRALAPLTVYRVVLTRGLRTTAGAPFATQIEWSFTTGGDPIWERSVELGQGRLLACEPSRRGGVIALWAAPDESVLFARGDGISWSPPIPVGITGVLAAEVADDATNRVVVAATAADFSARVATAIGGVFAPPELVTGATAIVTDVDVADSGHVALCYWDGMASAAVRSFVPGVGWVAPFQLFGTRLHTRLQPGGDGIAVGAFVGSPPSGPGQPPVTCVQFAVDGIGVWTAVDPLPALGSFVGQTTSTARFRDDRVLLAPETSLGAPLWERTSFGWQAVGVQLGPDPRASDIAQGPFGTAAAALIEAGELPRMRRRIELGFTIEPVGDEAQPAPPNPAIGVAVDDEVRTHVLYTAAIDDREGAPVRLMSFWRTANGTQQDLLPVDGPFPVSAPLDELCVVSLGAGGVVAVWSRGGQVRSSALR